MTTSKSSQAKRIPGSLLAVLILLAISVFINYVDRGNLSIAAPMLKDELGISATQLGILLSAFFWTYAGMQLFSGWLVDRWNVNWVFAGGFLLWSAATAATGMVHAFSALFILRLTLGWGESVAYPSYCKIIALNFTEQQRGFANALIASGLMLGPGFGMLFGGLLMARFGWRTFFIALGLGSMLWIFPWLKWMPKNNGNVRMDAGGAPNLLEFLGMRSAWGTCLGLFCSNYSNYFLITWLPFYLVRERGFSMQQMAKIGGVAYLAGSCASTVAGWLSDRWVASGATPTLVRKTVVAGGISLAGVFIGLSVLGSSQFCVAAIIIGVLCFGASSSNVWAITQTLAGPKATGRWTGFQSFVGNLSGIVAPALTGLVLQRTGHFQWAFAILMGVTLLGAASWAFLIGPIEQATWSRKLQPVKVLD